MRPCRLSSTTCTLPLSASCTRTTVGSRRTPRVVIGEALATWTNVAVVVAVRRPSEAVTVTVRVTSVLASGSGAVNRASV